MAPSVLVSEMPSHVAACWTNGISDKNSASYGPVRAGLILLTRLLAETERSSVYLTILLQCREAAGVGGV